MFIHNFSLGKNKMSKILIFIAVLLIILLLFFSIRSIYNSSKEEGKMKLLRLQVMITQTF